MLTISYFEKFKMTSLRSELICGICEHILSEPVTLPCGCIVCNVHTHDATATKNAKIKCGECEKEFKVPKDGFRASKLVKKLLASESHLNEADKLLKHALEARIRQIEQSQSEFTSAETNPDLTSHAFFSEVRRLIDLQREVLKVKIDEIAHKMIEESKKHEAIYVAMLTEAHSKVVRLDTALMSHMLAEEFRKKEVDFAAINILKTAQEKEISELEAKISVYHCVKDKMCEFEFKANVNFSEQAIFGCLHVSIAKQCLISCSSDKTIKIWDSETNSPGR